MKNFELNCNAHIWFIAIVLCNNILGSTFRFSGTLALGNITAGKNMKMYCKFNGITFVSNLSFNHGLRLV